jgi:allophanate hydrolase
VPVSDAATDSLDLVRLRADYAAGRRNPSAVVTRVLARIAAAGNDGVWITRTPEQALRKQAEQLDAELAADPGVLDRRPLFGAPFAVKDNIDVAGLPTTAACPAFAYTAQRSAFAVQRLVDAGALVVGKTNLDQFATGLVGVRTPYGIARNPFDADYLPGGSSSGSAVAVAAGLVSFALGTDTAGSGRVPAGFNNIVGLKPSLGLISTTGLVPACRSLDVISIFALSVPDGLAVLRTAGGFDAADIYSRPAPAGWAARLPPLRPSLRLAVPRVDQRRFFGNANAEQLFEAAIARLQDLGATLTEIDYAPLAEAAAVSPSAPRHSMDFCASTPTPCTR